MPLYIKGHTLSLEKHFQALTSRLQPCFQNHFLDSIEKYEVTTKNVRSMAYAKHEKRAFLKNNISCQILKTFINLEVKQQKKHHLTLTVNNINKRNHFIVNSQNIIVNSI